MFLGDGPDHTTVHAEVVVWESLVGQAVELSSSVEGWVDPESRQEPATLHLEQPLEQLPVGAECDVLTLHGFAGQPTSGAALLNRNCSESEPHTEPFM